MLLTVDADGQAALWGSGSPKYFEDDGKWDHPLGPVASSRGVIQSWPELPDYAEMLSLESGPEGIAEVTVEIKRK